jgi:hypothetical protein
VAGKLLKASKECSGTVPNAWYFVANDFEQSAEIHKSIANIMLEEIAKPLKVFRIVDFFFLVDKLIGQLGPFLRIGFHVLPGGCAVS